MDCARAVDRSLVRVAKITILALPAALMVACTNIHYYVSTHKDPAWIPPRAPIYFALTEADDSSECDRLVELNLNRLVDSLLLSKNLVREIESNANLIFDVSCSVTDAKGYKQKGVYTWYDNKGRPHSGGGAGSTITEYTREVNISCYEIRAGERILVWTAECISRGENPDPLLPAKYMVPYAMQVFPQQGTWKKKVVK